MFATLPRWAGRARALTALRESIPGARWLGEKLLGVAAGRALPRAAPRSFLATPGLADDPRPDVVLLVDTFSNHFEPQNAHAALKVLRAAGRRVAIARAADGARPLCCGRTLLTAGLVDEATQEARRLVEALAPHVASGAVVVGLEPSCLLSLRDEFLALGLGASAATLSERALLLPEYLMREHAAGRLSLPLRPLAQKRALVHGHCHQKAFDAFAPTLAALRLVPGLAVEAVESSCCGMAGSFGYEAEHAEVSLRMAELSLLPAVRAAGADTLVVADGTSCRHQIADGTRAGVSARAAVHAVRVLADALLPDSGDVPGSRG
jgi:Fe-S oxidoreductase